MTLEEQGAYFRLLNYSYPHGLENNDKQLLTLLGKDDAFIPSLEKIKTCFKLTSSRLHHDLLDGEYENYKKRIDGNAKGGKKSAKVKQQKRKFTIKSTSSQLPSQPQVDLGDIDLDLKKDLNKDKDLKTKEKAFKNISFEKNHLELAELLRDCILNNDPKAKITDKKVELWANDVRLMVERDGRELPEICRILEFSQNDEFWRSNILSMSKLRKQYTQLLIKSQKPRSRAEERQRRNYEATQKYLRRHQNEQ